MAKKKYNSYFKYLTKYILPIVSKIFLYVLIKRFSKGVILPIIKYGDLNKVKLTKTEIHNLLSNLLIFSYITYLLTKL